jgi:hypothetical protein
MKKPIMQWLLPAVIGFSSLTACKKDKDEPISTPTPTLQLLHQQQIK